MTQYTIIFCFLLLSGTIGSLLYGIAYTLAVKTPTFEKVSAYECGFDPFSTTYKTFDVRYYLISILFIIFDLEISFLFPWSIVFLHLGAFGYGSILILLAILTFGYIYEWSNNALDWQ